MLVLPSNVSTVPLPDRARNETGWLLMLCLLDFCASWILSFPLEILGFIWLLFMTSLLLRLFFLLPLELLPFSPPPLSPIPSSSIFFSQLLFVFLLSENLCFSRYCCQFIPRGYNYIRQSLKYKDLQWIENLQCLVKRLVRSSTSSPEGMFLIYTDHLCPISSTQPAQDCGSFYILFCNFINPL